MRFSGTFAVAALALFFTSKIGLAGGSISNEDVRKILPRAVRDHLEASFNIPDVGGAEFRLGRHFKHLGGARMGPYTFHVTSKASKNGPELELVIHTEGTFLDARGREVDGDPETSVEIREEFVSYEVQFPGEGRRDEDHSEHDDSPAPNQPLTEDRKVEIVDFVRAVYGEIEKMRLNFEKQDFESDDGLSGTISRGIDRNGTMRKVDLDVATGDHGGFGVEIYLDQQQRPAFVLWEDSHWQFDPKKQGSTIDYVTEYRFYFSPEGQLARALTKSFEGSGEAARLKARDKAKNAEFHPSDDVAAFELWEKLNEISLSENRVLVGKSEELLKAWDLVQGRE
ncbi:MAG: hypothetical protein HKN23_00310 [Verrucomicrobiales bacterium]|nr:hypothetical protein [Verrucomicrobiales bacterium]